ncbi:BTAD domain-containing putative transcriptional regulator [Streptomyces sp. CA-251387]|uniref:BTAD domain-containing putative transcriptional regulator n=1 Tax=Streptomyces sp. CA-251387 TaxID=3240064 RepID=UPI003D925065
MADGRWGDVLRTARIQAGLTQDEVARRAEISVRTVRHIEHGRVTPRPATLARMSQVFGYDLAATGSEPGRSQLPCEIRVLGPLTVLCAGFPVAMPLKQRALIGLLAVQPDQIVGHEEIADVLWSGAAPPRYRHLLYTYVARLRRLIEPRSGRQGAAAGRRISTVRGGYVLHSRGMGLDLCRFEEGATRAARTAPSDPVGAFELYGQALGGWQGRLLQDLPQLWQHPAVVRMAQRHIDVAIEFADLALRLGRPDDAVEQLGIAAREEPLHEALQARIVLTLAGAGRRAAALRLFTDLRQRLRTELGVEPGDELWRARRTILKQDGPGRSAGTEDRQPPAAASGASDQESSDDAADAPGQGLFPPARPVGPSVRLPPMTVPFTKRRQPAGSTGRRRGSARSVLRPAPPPWAVGRPMPRRAVTAPRCAGFAAGHTRRAREALSSHCRAGGNGPSPPLTSRRVGRRPACTASQVAAMIGAWHRAPRGHAALTGSQRTMPL